MTDYFAQSDRNELERRLLTLEGQLADLRVRVAALERKDYQVNTAIDALRMYPRLEAE